MTDPILQIMQIKNIQNNMDGLTRYKMTLYDGETQHTCKNLEILRFDKQNFFIILFKSWHFGNSKELACGEWRIESWKCDKT